MKNSINGRGSAWTGSAQGLNMPDRDKGSNERRGLASADEKTRERVAREGGEAPHPHGRGLQNASEETRERVARAGGEASHKIDDKKRSSSSRGRG